MSDEYLTVGKLKEILADVDDDLVVLSEGCDCIEEAVTAKVGENWVRGEGVDGYAMATAFQILRIDR